MENLREATLAELVIRHSGAADIFEKYQLDYCCQGKYTLEEACTKQGLDVAALEIEVDTMLPSDNPQAGFPLQNLTPDALADYIVERHHAYTKQILPLLATYTKNVVERHGDAEPSLWDIDILMTELVGEMSAHMLKEEQLLFPYIRQLANATQAGGAAKVLADNPIQTLEMEHSHVGELLRQIRRLSNNYTPPTNASTNWRLIFSELNEFERNFHEHVHLENNLLFPAAVKMQERLFGHATESLHP